MTKFNSMLESLQPFVLEMGADWGLVYDWIEQQCGTNLTEEQWKKVEEIYAPLMEDSRY